MEKFTLGKQNMTVHIFLLFLIILDWKVQNKNENNRSYSFWTLVLIGSCKWGEG